MQKQFERTESLLGKNALKKLKQAKIILFGVGGVGATVAEQLIRTGFYNLTIVDFDKVSESNINRQIIALHSTVGKYKVDVMKERLLDINPKANITALVKHYDKEVSEEFELSKYDYVIDAIDLVNQKLDLIEQAKTEGAKIISAMGSGNKAGIPNFVVTDVFKTSGDGLSRKLRNVLKKRGIKSHTVVSSNSLPTVKPSGKQSSIVYQPWGCACVLAGKVTNDIINFS